MLKGPQELPKKINKYGKTYLNTGNAEKISTNQVTISYKRCKNQAIQKYSVWNIILTIDTHKTVIVDRNAHHNIEDNE